MFCCFSWVPLSRPSRIRPFQSHTDSWRILCWSYLSSPFPLAWGNYPSCMKLAPPHKKNSFYVLLDPPCLSSLPHTACLREKEASNTNPRRTLAYNGGWITFWACWGETPRANFDRRIVCQQEGFIFSRGRGCFFIFYFSSCGCYYQAYRYKSWRCTLHGDAKPIAVFDVCLCFDC